ncbi:MAG TPA: neutral/alkaline non-lysosomal ceramidase N-terminal domain-containing protein, partial [Tepidisphaeraceae bacterium]|nr:neutral/alkaline non-lysosomal ceramidase N-terminal domain-containing protein [Tepidisphaeraceae bacterium]
HSVQDPLELRAIVFESHGASVAIVSLDLIGVVRSQTESIRATIQLQCGIKPDHVLLAASHTHSGPAMRGNGDLIPDAAFVAMVQDRAVEAVAEAQRKLEPVTLALGCGSASFNVNRRPVPGLAGEFQPNFAEIVDRRVRVLRVNRAGGEPLAVLFHFSCHPTTKRGSDGFISPDFPGLARSLIEQAFNCSALFLQGCCGNVRPLMVNEKNEFVAANREQLQGVADQLARGVIDATKNLTTSSFDELSATEREMFLPYGQPRSRSELDAMLRGTTPVDLAVKVPWATKTLDLIARHALPKGRQSQIQSIRIGPLQIIAIPGEPVQEIGHAIERTLCPRTDAQEIWPTGYANDSIGYLCTIRQHEQGGYEPNAYTHFDQPAPYHDEESAIVNAAQKLFAS